MTQTPAAAERIEREGAFLADVVREVGRVIVGQKALLDGMLIGLLADGHVLLEGVPGLAKSLAVESLEVHVEGCPQAPRVHRPGIVRLPSDQRQAQPPG